MSFKNLWELGEIYNAPLNFFLILLGMSFAKYNYGMFYDWRVIWFAITLTWIYIAVNVHDNYMDYNHSDDENFRQNINIIGRENLDIKKVRNVYLFFLFLSLVFGAILVFYADFYILLLGLFGLYVGFGYAGGKHPINGMPIAEIVPGTLSGFMIPLMSAYLVVLGKVSLSINFVILGIITFLPTVLCVASGLLVNNTCDLDEDIKNHRKTLVYYLGKKQSVILLNISVILIFVWILGLVILHQVPWTLIFVLLAIPSMLKTLKSYNKVQDKKTTYVSYIKSMSLIMAGYPLMYFIGILFLK